MGYVGRGLSCYWQLVWIWRPIYHLLVTQKGKEMLFAYLCACLFLTESHSAQAGLDSSPLALGFLDLG